MKFNDFKIITRSRSVPTMPKPVRLLGISSSTLQHETEAVPTRPINLAWFRDRRARVGEGAGHVGKLVLAGPSSRYVDDDAEGYVGGLSAAQIEELLQFLESNHMGWPAQTAPAIMGNPDRPELGILPDASRVIVRGFPLEAFNEAKESLVFLEKKFKGTRNQAVLVATASLNELRRAYPNYFADTKVFIEVLRSFVR